MFKNANHAPILEEGIPLADEQLDAISGGGKGGKVGCCPGCGCNEFVDLGGGKIKCKECGWEGTREDISVH